MKIGIIGTGSMGRALGSGWARAGHDVLFGSRDTGKAKLAAGDLGKSGNFDDAAAFGSVVLYTVRDVLLSKLLRAPQTLAGKIVIDCTNSAILGVEVPDSQGRPGIHFETQVPSRAERLAADVPDARVVKAFNAIPATVIALGAEKLRANSVPVFLCAADDEAKSTVKRLAEDLGFVGMDSGTLEHARLVEGAADLLRLQIVAMGLGAWATLSIKVLNSPEHDPEKWKPVFRKDHAQTKS
jgi:8-hydroxy-5-deazaflavin:NADPH oxidoreductase